LDLAAKKQLIDIDNEELTISQQCELLGLNRTSFYYKPQGLKDEDYKVMNRIDEIFTEHPYYGTRRMAAVLNKEDYNIGRKKVRYYYEVMGIIAIYPKRNLSKRNQAHKVYPYLLRDLKIDRANMVWSCDITYIRLKQGFVYLAAIIDCYSRKVLSYRVSISLQNDFCIEALESAVSKYGKPEIFNSDQGVQFTAENFTEKLLEYGIKISMDGKGRALDNVYIERFWRSIKQEKIYITELESVKGAKQAIGEYIEFYNNRRPHQSLEYQTPDDIYNSRSIYVIKDKKPITKSKEILPAA
jgi:putative transposase